VVARQKLDRTASRECTKLHGAVLAFSC
jgi:hypothetical protein